MTWSWNGPGPPRGRVIPLAWLRYTDVSLLAAVKSAAWCQRIFNLGRHRNVHLKLHFWLRPSHQTWMKNAVGGRISVWEQSMGSRRQRGGLGAVRRMWAEFNPLFPRFIYLGFLPPLLLFQRTERLRCRSEEQARRFAPQVECRWRDAALLPHPSLRHPSPPPSLINQETDLEIHEIRTARW